MTTSAPSCWPAKSATECALGHPISRQLVEVVDWRKDANGDPMYDPRSGEKLTETRHVPAHMPFPHTLHDPTGMVLAPGCPHGLKAHPLTGQEGLFVGGDELDDGTVTAKMYTSTFIRVRHQQANGKCPECSGKPRPADLDEPADHPCLR